MLDASNTLETTIDILAQLVAFPSLSGEPTHEIVGYINALLSAQGIACRLTYDDAGERANIFATIGPPVDGGVVLSGHTDVVPIDGQDWASDPFTLTRRGDRLYGRGSVDMKGFLACMLGSVPMFQAADLQRPVHFAFSYDEETGGIGMPGLLEGLAEEPFRPALVLVGEPTEMKIVTGHKGGVELRCEIIGHEAHSSVPARGVNAISVAAQLMGKIEEIGARLAAAPYPNSAFDPPYATFNIGIIEGGAARNATAGWCNFDWEMRPMPGEAGKDVIAEVTDFAMTQLLPAMKEVSDKADIRVITEVDVPSLDDRNAEAAASFVAEITGQNAREVVSFGTDAGYFSDQGYSAVVVGPGSINRAHAPDEYIEIAELEQGLALMRGIAKRLSEG